MTEDRNAPRMHPDDLAALKRAMLEGPIRVPPPSPNEVPTGLDARLLREIVADIVGRSTALFLTGDQIRDAIREENHDMLRSIGLRVDAEHIEETGNAIRNVLKWQRRIEVAGNTVIGGLILTAFYAIAKLIGIKLPNPPGMGG